MTPNITVYTQSCIRISCNEGVVYFDPFRMKEAPHDADYILVTHDHFDHFSPEDIDKVSKSDTILIIPEKMLAKARKNCAACRNATYAFADITALGYPDESFDKVVAGNVIHLLDEPLKALAELKRVCRPGGTLIIPTYMNRDRKGRTSGFAKTVGRAGADFKRQFTVESYRQFFLDAGYRDVQITLAEGRIPCAVAVMKKQEGEQA